MSLTFWRRTTLAAAGLLAMAGCSDREDPQLTYTYEKLGMNEQSMLYDEQILKNTSGVTKVFPTLDHGRVEIELYVEEDNKIPGLEKAQELGYTQVQHDVHH